MIQKTALIGISPKNSYFSEQNIHKILAYCEEHFGETLAMIPDLPYIHTLTAQGKKKPRSIARKDANALANRINRYEGRRTQIVRWEGITGHQKYRSELTAINDLLRSNTQFEKEVNQTTEQVNGIKANNITTARQYLLEELAYLAAAKVIHNLPIDPVYIYHRTWPIFDKWRMGEFDGRTKPVEFTIIKF